MKHSDLKAKVEARLKSEGFDSLYAACRERRVDYQLARRAILAGLNGKTTLKTVDELKRLGILDLVKASA